MSAENEEIYNRLRTLEREVFLISDIVKDLKNERIVSRLVVLEEFAKEVKDDVSSIEKLSQEIAGEVKNQKSLVRGFLMAMSVIFVLVQTWPTIKELLKGAIE